MNINKQACQECGMILNHPAEFHPYEFCILYRAGQNPRGLYSRIADHAKQTDHPTPIGCGKR